MREVLFRVTQLLSVRAVLGWWLALACVGIALTWLPLLGQPGYELASGLTLLLTFAGGGLAITAARARPGQWASATLLACATLPVPAVGDPAHPLRHAVRSLRQRRLRAAAGAAHRRAGRRAGRARAPAHQALVAGRCWSTWASSRSRAVSTVWPLLAGPQVFAFNHLGGYLPGPLYDEELSVPASLLWFRLATICLALGIGALLQRRRGLGLARCWPSRSWSSSGTRLGFRMTDEALADALGGVVETDELILHYPRGPDRRGGLAGAGRSPLPPSPDRRRSSARLLPGR